MKTPVAKVWRVAQAIGDIAFAYPYSLILLEIQVRPPVACISSSEVRLGQKLNFHLFHSLVLPMYRTP